MVGESFAQEIRQWNGYYESWHGLLISSPCGRGAGNANLGQSIPERNGGLRMDKVERVARALQIASIDNAPAWEEIPEYIRNNYRVSAKAAIVALDSEPVWEK